VVTSKGRARLELFVVGLAALVVSLSQSLLFPVISTLPASLGTSATNVSWLITSTLLVGAVSVPIMGRLGDMFGTRRLLLVSVGGLASGSLLTAVTDDMGLLILGRSIQGLGGATIPLGISLLTTLMPPRRAGSAIALVSAMLGVGGALGLPVAGYVAERAGFHALFWITSAAGFASFAGIVAVVPESPIRAGGRIDLAGAVLLSSGLACLMLPLTQGSVWGWDNPRVGVLLVASAMLLAVFGLSQTLIRQPLVDLAVLSRKPIVLTNLASVLFGFALFASFVGTAAYVEAPVATGYGFGSSLMVGGLVLLPSGLAMLVLSPVAARLTALHGAPQTLALGAAFVAGGWILRLLVHENLWQVVVGTTVVGVGTGIGYAAIPSLINAHTPASEIAASNSLNALFRTLGSSLAAAVGGSILAADTVVLQGFAAPSLTAYRALFVLCAAAATSAAIIVLLIPQRRPAAS